MQTTTKNPIRFAMTLSLIAPLALATACVQQDEPVLPTAISLASEVMDDENDQPPQIADKPFLETVVGHWKGRCDIVNPGSPNVNFEVEMERIVEPTDDPNRYTWQIIYRTPEFEQLRDYNMIIIDEERGHYQVDENNGVFLDMFYFTNGILTSNFDVGDIRIIGHETFRNNRLNLQFLSSRVTPLTTSTVGDFVANSYAFLSNQNCKLKRKRNRRR